MPHHHADAHHHPLPGDEKLDDEQRINAAIAYMNEAALRAAQLFGVAVIVPEAVGADHTQDQSSRNSEDTAMVSIFFGRLNFLKGVDGIDSQNLFPALSPVDANLMRQAAHMSAYPTRVGRLCFMGDRFYVYRGFDRVKNALVLQDAFSRRLHFFKHVRDAEQAEPKQVGGVTLGTLSGATGNRISDLRIFTASDDFAIRTLMQVAGRAYFTPKGTHHSDDTRHVAMRFEAAPLSEAMARESWGRTPGESELPPWDLDLWLKEKYFPSKTHVEAGAPLKPITTETTISENADGTVTANTREVAEEGESLFPISDGSRVWGLDLAAPGSELSVGAIARRNPDGTLSLDLEATMDTRWAGLRTAGFGGTITGRTPSGPAIQEIPRTRSLGDIGTALGLSLLQGAENLLETAVQQEAAWIIYNRNTRRAIRWCAGEEEATREVRNYNNTPTLGPAQWTTTLFTRWDIITAGLLIFPRQPVDVLNSNEQRPDPRAMIGNAGIMPRYRLERVGRPDAAPFYFYSSADMDAYTDAHPEVEWRYTSLSYEAHHTLAESARGGRVDAARVANAFGYYIRQRIRERTTTMTAPASATATQIQETAAADLEGMFITGVEETRPDDANPGELVPLNELLRTAGFFVTGDGPAPVVANFEPRGTFSLDVGADGRPVLTGRMAVPLETVTVNADPAHVAALAGVTVNILEGATEAQLEDITDRLIGFGLSADAAYDAGQYLSDNYDNAQGLIDDLARVEEARDLGNVTNEQILDAINADMATDDLAEYEVSPWTQFLDENGLIPFPYEGAHSEPQEGAEGGLPSGRGVAPPTLDPSHRAALNSLVQSANSALVGLGDAGLLTSQQMERFGALLHEEGMTLWQNGDQCPNCEDGSLMVHYGDGENIVECGSCGRDPRRGPPEEADGR